MASAEEDNGSNSRPPIIASVVTTAVMDMDLPLPDAQPVVASAVTVPMIRKQAAVATQDQDVPQSRCPGLKLCTGCGHRSGPRAVKCPRCARSFYTQAELNEQQQARQKKRDLVQGARALGDPPQADQVTAPSAPAVPSMLSPTPIGIRPTESSPAGEATAMVVATQLDARPQQGFPGQHVMELTRSHLPIQTVAPTIASAADQETSKLYSSKRKLCSGQPGKKKCPHCGHLSGVRAFKCGGCTTPFYSEAELQVMPGSTKPPKMGAACTTFKISPQGGGKPSLPGCSKFRVNKPANPPAAEKRQDAANAAMGMCYSITVFQQDSGATTDFRHNTEQVTGSRPKKRSLIASGSPGKKKCVHCSSLSGVRAIKCNVCEQPFYTDSELLAMPKLGKQRRLAVKKGLLASDLEAGDEHGAQQMLHGAPQVLERDLQTASDNAEGISKAD